MRTEVFGGKRGGKMKKKKRKKMQGSRCHGRWEIGYES